MASKRRRAGEGSGTTGRFVIQGVPWKTRGSVSRNKVGGIGSGKEGGYLPVLTDDRIEAAGGRDRVAIEDLKADPKTEVGREGVGGEPLHEEGKNSGGSGNGCHLGEDVSICGTQPADCGKGVPL